MEVLVLDGKNYVKASKAARDLGYATDYVGQLCRSGQVDAHLIGRTWYVNQEQLSTHRVEKKRMSRVKAREYAKKSIEEHRIKISSTQNNYKNIDIQYESDANELIPVTRKLTIASVEPVVKKEKGKKVFVQSEPIRDPELLSDDERYPDNTTTVINEGEKVVMSGTVNVVDVTDGPEDLDSITLTPTRIRRGSVKKVTKVEPESNPLEVKISEEADISSENMEDSTSEETPNFLKRLQDREVTLETPKEDSLQEQTISFMPQQIASTQKSAPLYPYVLSVVVVILGVILLLPLTQVVTYSDKITTSYVYKLDEVYKIIQSKI